MTDEIRERLSLSRAGMAGDLAPWEREQAQRDPVLREEIELNTVLGRINRDSRTPPPPMHNLMNRARHAARFPGQRPYRPAFLDRWLQTIEEKLPMSPRELVARVALAVAVLVLWPMLLNALGVVFQPCGRHAVEEAGPMYRLTYAIQVPIGRGDTTGGHTDPINGGDISPRVTEMVRGTEVVFSEMMARFSDWSAQHPELTKYMTFRTDLSYEDLFHEQWEKEGWAPEGRVGSVCIEVDEVDEAIAPTLLRELTELFEEMPEVGECIVVNVRDGSGDAYNPRSDGKPEAE